MCAGMGAGEILRSVESMDAEEATGPFVSVRAGRDISGAVADYDWFLSLQIQPECLLIFSLPFFSKPVPVLCGGGFGYHIQTFQRGLYAYVSVA